MYEQENYKTLDFLFLVTLNNIVNFNGLDFVDLNVVALNLNGNDSYSNPSRSNQVSHYMCV